MSVQIRDTAGFDPHAYGPYAGRLPWCAERPHACVCPPLAVPSADEPHPTDPEPPATAPEPPPERRPYAVDSVGTPNPRAEPLPPTYTITPTAHPVVTNLGTLFDVIA